MQGLLAGGTRLSPASRDASTSTSRSRSERSISPETPPAPPAHCPAPGLGPRPSPRLTPGHAVCPQPPSYSSAPPALNALLNLHPLALRPSSPLSPGPEPPPRARVTAWLTDAHLRSLHRPRHLPGGRTSGRRTSHRPRHFPSLPRHEAAATLAPNAATRVAPS